MNSKKTLIALSTAVVLGLIGTSSLALASDHENQSGGFKIGPLGQVMGAPTWTAPAPGGRDAYAFVPSVQSKQSVHKQTTHRIAPQEDNYGPEAGKD